MLIAVNFSITSITLWFLSGRRPSTTPTTSDSKSSPKAQKTTPKTASTPPDPNSRPLSRPLAILTTAHFLGAVQHHLLLSVSATGLIPFFLLASLLTLTLPHLTALTLTNIRPLTLVELQLTSCTSLLILGIALATLSTLNFSLSLLLGLLAAPLSFTAPRAPPSPRRAALHSLLLLLCCPATVLLLAATAQALSPTSAAGQAPLHGPAGLLSAAGLEAIASRVRALLGAAVGAHAVGGTWTSVVVWLVWWPAWVMGAFVSSPAVRVRQAQLY